MARFWWIGWMALVGCGPSVSGDGTSMSGTGGSDHGGTAASTGQLDASGTGSGPTTAATTGVTTMPASDTAPATSDTGEATTTTGDMGVCGPFLDQCGVDCSNDYQCGVLGSWFDDYGCLYMPCSTEATCPDDGICFYPQEWGMCASSGVSCSDQAGMCQCTMDADCGGEFCMPAGTAPPVQCNLVDAAQCTDSGCTGNINVRPIVDAGGGACLCDLEVPQCAWVSPDATVTMGDKTAYSNLLSGEVFVFPDHYDPPPAGWVACDDLDVSTPECDCAALLPCAM